jgi:2-alkenal reductase
MRTGLAALAAALLAAGCGDTGGGAVEGASDQARTTRVEVIDRTEADVGFDPEALYAREAPGVVTVFAVFGGGGVLEQGEGQQGVGSGFVVSGDGEVATNAHVVTQGEAGDIRPADEVYVQFADRNQVEAQIVGFDPKPTWRSCASFPGGSPCARCRSRARATWW